MWSGSNAVEQDDPVSDDRPVTSTLDVESASVFDVYDELLVPLCFQAYADDVVERVDDLEEGSVLVVACGTGVDTRALAGGLPPSVAITATDLVPGMVERAQRSGSARPVTWDVADAAALPYGDESYDVVVCQFGAMFFPSKVDAFAELARALRPRGRLELATWDAIDANDFAAAVAGAMGDCFPDDPPRFLAGPPYSYHDADTISADLVAGGFDRPRVDRVGHTARAATAETVAAAFCGGTPLRDQLQSGGVERLARALEGAADALARRFGSTDLTGRTAALAASAV